MDFSGYRDGPVRLAIDLVNTREEFSGEERLTEAEDVQALVEPYAAEWQHPDWVVTEKDVHELRALRAQLRRVFAAEDDSTAAEILNEILSASDASPRVSVHCDVAPHLHFDSRKSSPSNWVGAITAMGLAVVLVDHGIARFGVCASSTCEDVFVDSSRNRSRRHCSDTCNSRENVAAYRRRQAEAST